MLPHLGRLAEFVPNSERETVVGQQITWQYALVWTPEARQPQFTLYRRSSAGHIFTWAAVPGPELTKTPSVDTVLASLYDGLLALMESTA